jgi:hypothetical protein
LSKMNFGQKNSSGKLQREIRGTERSDRWIHGLYTGAAAGIASPSEATNTGHN